MIAYLKQNRFGRATFLPIQSIVDRSGVSNDVKREPGVVGTASELVGYDKKFQSIIGHLLGRIVVVDHINHAMALAKKYKQSLRIVTLEGELINPGGALTGGAFKNTSNPVSYTHLPRVGIINIGAEDEKGNELVKSTIPLLRECKDINFIGSVESRDIPNGPADVLVCEAFVGNVLLKFFEGLGKMFMAEIKDTLKSSVKTKIGGALIYKPIKKTFKRYMADDKGGAPLLGLKGLVVKIHGNSKDTEVRSAIEQCRNLSLIHI